MLRSLSKYRVKNIGSRRTKRKSRKGQTLVEYALILAFISIVAISVLISIGKQVTLIFSKVTTTLVSAQASH
jgi:Flp pilus assembly pilin Flp